MMTLHVANTIQELRDACEFIENGQEIVADFSHLDVINQEDGEADLAAMLHFAEKGGAVAIRFNDWIFKINTGNPSTGEPIGE